MSLPDYAVTVDYVSEGEVTNLIRGFVAVKGERVRFSGVAYGRFGGQNFSPQFSASAKKRLEELTGDFPKFEEDLQLRLVRGDFEVKPKEGEQHAHKHLDR